MLNKAFFAAWLIAGSTIDNIFNSKGAMMVFVIAMIVIRRMCGGDGNRQMNRPHRKRQHPQGPGNINVYKEIIA